MRFNVIERWRHFRSDVDREITFLITRHHDQAYKAALEAASRPNLRTRRRKVLKAAARALNPTPRLFGLIKLPKSKPTKSQISKTDPSSVAS